MNNNKPHLFYNNIEKHNYFASSGGGSPSLTPKDRSEHGKKLILQYDEALNILNEKLKER